MPYLILFTPEVKLKMATFIRNFRTCYYNTRHFGLNGSHRHYLCFSKQQHKVCENVRSNSIRNLCTPQTKTVKESAVRRLHHISSVEDRLCNSRKISLWNKCFLNQGKRALSVQRQCLRPYSSQENPGDSEDGGDNPTWQGSQSQYLPTPLTVPDYFPRVPVLAVNRNPVFPKFSKMLEVCFYFLCVFFNYSLLLFFLMKNTLVFTFFKIEKLILHYFMHLIYFKNNSIKPLTMLPCIY